MILFIQAAAEQDILRQVEWYAQRELPHIAERFHQAVMDAIDALCAMPEAGPRGTRAIGGSPGYGPGRSEASTNSGSTIWFAATC